MKRKLKNMAAMALSALLCFTAGAVTDPTYKVTVKEGTEDAGNWTIDPAAATNTGVKAGTSVTAAYAGAKRVKSVKAKKAAPATVPVTAITLNKTETSIQVDNNETLSVTSVLPEDATDKTYTWSSDNTDVATVDADGTVSAKAVGTANITATANDGSGVTATCAVTVNTVVTITQSDFSGEDSFTKNGVTVSAGIISPGEGSLMNGGSFSTTLGNFTKIEVTAVYVGVSGTGWSGESEKKIWTGNASSVSFSGNILGLGMGTTTLKFTIGPKD